MTQDIEATTPHEDLRQGDVISVSLGKTGESVDLIDDPCCVAIVSQSCDVAQRSKSFCLVAPAQQIADDEHRAALKGRKPLLVPLDDDCGGRWTADLSRAFSIRKSVLRTAQVIVRCAESAHGQQAARIRSRISRAFGRFPFPDEVHPVLAKLEDRIRSKAGTPGNLGKVIDLIDDIRVTADQWDKPGRHLKLYLIISSNELIPADDCDPSWTWSRVRGWSTHDEYEPTLDRVCELILANHNGGDDDHNNDLTTLCHLWRKFGTALFSALIEPHLNDEVSIVDVEVISDADMTLHTFLRTERLDLQALSESNLRG